MGWAPAHLQSIRDIEQVPVGLGKNGIPIFLKDVAHIQLGPEMRRGITDFNGLGDTVGGIVVMRHGEDAPKVIELVKDRPLGNYLGEDYHITQSL